MIHKLLLNDFGGKVFLGLLLLATVYVAAANLVLAPGHLRCAVHALRPGVCRIFPFTVELGEREDETFTWTTKDGDDKVWFHGGDDDFDEEDLDEENEFEDEEGEDVDDDEFDEMDDDAERRDDGPKRRDDDL